MNAPGSPRSERDARRLEAYHDGALRGWARRRFERRVAGSAELERELRMLERIGLALRERDAWGPAPVLWRGIAGRLPAAAARREPASAQPRSRGRLAERLLPLLRPAGAVAAAALAVVLLLRGWSAPAEPAGSVVRWIDTGGRSVLVLEGAAGQAGDTVIWLLDLRQDEVRWSRAHGAA